MPTAQQFIFGFIIFFGLSIALALLWGKFTHAGKGQDEQPTAKNLADRMDQLRATQTALMIEMIEEVQERLADNRRILAELYTVPTDPKVIQHRAMVYGDIMDDERVLQSLLGTNVDWDYGGDRMNNAANMRSHYDLRNQMNSANLWEGRM